MMRTWVCDIGSIKRSRPNAIHRRMRDKVYLQVLGTLKHSIKSILRIWTSHKIYVANSIVSIHFDTFLSNVFLYANV
ncbi:uncharacterized protein BDV14DRAFT_164564 [Aspergillus stella-maris]|uniref:uncharacterized protein n=1 Tax=Aspergillus stella-maris TaxID=1810926 RepID=UPI003CCD5117